MIFSKRKYWIFLIYLIFIFSKKCVEYCFLLNYLWDIHLDKTTYYYFWLFDIHEIIIYNFKGSRHLIVNVWQPLENLLAPSSKTVDDREKVFWGNMSGATQITLWWHSHGTLLNDVACRSASVYVPDWPTFSLRSNNLKRLDRFWSFKHCWKALGNGLGPSFVKKFRDDE